MGVSPYFSASNSPTTLFTVLPKCLMSARLAESYESISVEVEQNAYAVPSMRANQYMRTVLQAAAAGAVCNFDSYTTSNLETN